MMIALFYDFEASALRYLRHECLSTSQVLGRRSFSLLTFLFIRNIFIFWYSMLDMRVFEADTSEMSLLMIYSRLIQKLYYLVKKL